MKGIKFNDTTIDFFTIKDLPKFTNKIYINMANATALNGLMSLPCVESSNFVVAFPDGTSQEYVEPTTLIEHQFADANQEGWIYIYGDWKGATLENMVSNRPIITMVEYDNNITEIPKYAFYNCENLGVFNFPDSIKTIREGAFQNARIRELNLPENLFEIKNSAFYNCYALTVRIPNSVRIINAQAFGQVSYTRDIYLQGNSVYLYYNSFSINRLHFAHGTYPVLNSSTDLPYVRTFLVSQKELKKMKTLSNLTTYANKIYPEGGNYSETITIPSTAWDTTTNSATVEVVGSTTEARNVIEFVLLDADGKQAEDTYGLKGTQGTMQMTFTCEEIPKEDIKLYVVSTLTNY